MECHTSVQKPKLKLPGQKLIKQQEILTTMSQSQFYQKHDQPASLADTDCQTTVSELKAMVAEFVDERSWQPYHSPKNLAVSVVLEASELLEHFQWAPPASEELSPTKCQQIGEELCDVMAYLLSLANVLNIDVAKAMAAKMKKNRQKYPVSEYKGNWQKPEPTK